MFDIDKVDLRNKGSVKAWEKNIDIRYNRRSWYNRASEAWKENIDNRYNRQRERCSNKKLRACRIYIDNRRQLCSILESKAWCNTESKEWMYIEIRRGRCNSKSEGWRRYIENMSK